MDRQMCNWITLLHSKSNTTLQMSYMSIKSIKKNKSLETNENKNTVTQNPWDPAEAVLREKFSVI